ncbi:MAG: molybdenum ABC transporter ATP-binding protein [Pseudomonadota bacterium]
MIDVDIKLQLGGFTLQARFAVEARVVGLFGHSGAGKSTIVNAIAGVIRPDDGHIRIDGITLFERKSGIDLPPEARRVGYVFQDALLFPHLSVEANMLYGYRLQPLSTRVISLDQVVELLGLEGLLHRKPATLSGGERQRVAIGRALLAQPRILLMDEPLAALDTQRKAEILTYIERLREELGLPMIYVSHSTAEISRLADKVVLLSEGRSLAVGEAEMVMQRADMSVA